MCVAEPAACFGPLSLSKRDHLLEPEDLLAGFALRSAALCARAAKLLLDTPPPEARASADWMRLAALEVMGVLLPPLWPPLLPPLPLLWPWLWLPLPRVIVCLFGEGECWRVLAGALEDALDAVFGKNRSGHEAACRDRSSQGLNASANILRPSSASG
jgi:hypothetical protein